MRQGPLYQLSNYLLLLRHDYRQCGSTELAAALPPYEYWRSDSRVQEGSFMLSRGGSPTNLIWPLVMAFVRLPMMLLGNGIATLAYRFRGEPVGIEVGVAWNTFTVTVVNLIFLGLLSC